MKTAALVVAFTAGMASAQTPSASFPVPDFTMDPAIALFRVIPLDVSGTDFSSPYLAWRFTADWDGLDGVGGAFTTDYEVSLGDSATMLLLSSGEVQAYNAQMDANPVTDLGFAEAFPGPPPAGLDGLAGTTVDLLIEDTFGGGKGAFTNGVLEWFTNDDLPAVTTDPGPLSANAPLVFTDLGTLAVLGESIIFDTFGSDLADTEMALYAANGTLIQTNDDAGEIGQPNQRQSLVSFSGTSVEIDQADGSIMRRLLGAGEYYIAVAAFNSTFAGDFATTGSSFNSGDFVLNADVFTPARAGVATGTVGLNQVAWFRFTVDNEPEPQGCNAADIAEPFGELNLADVQDFLIGFAGLDPVADVSPDGQFNLSDVQDFLIAFGAGCPVR